MDAEVEGGREGKAAWADPANRIVRQKPDGRAFPQGHSQGVRCGWRVRCVGQRDRGGAGRHGLTECLGWGSFQPTFQVFQTTERSLPFMRITDNSPWYV